MRAACLMIVLVGVLLCGCADPIATHAGDETGSAPPAWTGTVVEHDLWTWRVELTRDGEPAGVLSDLRGRASPTLQFHRADDGTTLLRVSEGGHVGTGVGLFVDRWYRLEASPELLFTYPAEGWVIGWGQALDREFSTDVTAAADGSAVEVRWTVSLTPAGIESPSAACHAEVGIKFRRAPDGRYLPDLVDEYDRLWRLWSGTTDTLLADHFEHIRTLILPGWDGADDWLKQLPSMCETPEGRTLAKALTKRPE